MKNAHICEITQPIFTLSFHSNDGRFIGMCYIHAIPLKGVAVFDISAGTSQSLCSPICNMELQL